MYKFIFQVYYEITKKINENDDAAETARLLTLIAIVFHLFFVGNIVLYFSKYTSLQEVLNIEQPINKYSFLPFVVILTSLFFFFFNQKKMNQYIHENMLGKNIVNVKNVFIVLGITITPLLLGIWLLNSK
jgi:hypothetical protein